MGRICEDRVPLLSFVGISPQTIPAAFTPPATSPPSHIYFFVRGSEQAFSTKGKVGVVDLLQGSLSLA